MTEIQRIQEKVNYGVDRFKAYINSLVGLGSNEATNLEKSLFNLEAAYDDGTLRRDEVEHLRRSFQDLDFNKLVSESKIFFNSTQNVLEYRINTYDFNHDGVINQTDKAAVDYVINFFNNNANTLSNMLELAGNEDAISKYHIKNWAKERGMREGTAKFDAFVTKFYDQFYANPKVKASMQILASVLKLYDAGLGNENLDDLNNYVLLLKENQPLKLLVALYKFESSDAFNIPESQKPAMLDKIIAAILNKDVPERQKLVADSLTRGKIAILGEPLSASNLNSFIDRTNSKTSIAKMRIEDIAKKLGLENLQGVENDEYDLFIDKFLNKYYINDEKGVNMTDINNLARLYSRLKQIKGQEFNIDDLDVYAYALTIGRSKNKAYSGDLNLLVNLEMKAKENGLTAQNRDANLRKYIDILTGTDASDKKLKRHLQQALRTSHIPISAEVLTIDKLNSFLTTAVDDKAYLKLVIGKMANDKGLFDNPANANDGFDKFLSKFTNYAEGFTQSEKISKLSYLSQIYDGKIIDFNQLDILAIAVKNKASSQDINALVNYYKSDKFNIVNKSEKFREYAEILSGSDKDKKALLSGTLKTGRIPYLDLTPDQVTIRDIDETLAKLDEVDGQIELKLKQLARNSDIDPKAQPTEFKNFVKTTMSWFNDKKLRLQDISMLATFYKKTNKDLSDLAPYADALSKGVKAADIATIFKFEDSDSFNLSGSARDRTIQNYLDILSKPASNDADKERKNILINSIKADKIYLTGEKLTVTSLDDILARTTTDAAIFDIQSDSWAAKLEYPVNSSKYNKFKDTVALLRNTDDLSTTSISRSIGFLQVYPDLNFNDFSNVAKTLNRARKTSPEIRKIIDFIQSDKFSGTTASSNYKSEKLKEYLGILENGSQRERTVLIYSTKYGKIDLTEKELSASNLDQALAIARSEDDYTEQEIKKLAKAYDYQVGSSKYMNFKKVFFDGLYKEQKLSITDIRYLASFYASGVFSDAAFNEVIQARKQNVSAKALKNLEKYTNISGLGSDEQVEYLQILRGSQGSTKKRFLEQVFSANFIPIANARLF